MMKKILIVAFFVALTGCGETPVSVELGENPYWGTPQLKITSVVDNVTIKEVIVNRGSCKANVHPQLPHDLVMGASLIAGAMGCQSVVEVSIATSEGEYDFNFKE